ncbi:MAG: oligosaccharide flippase family protein [Pseudomonadota bacterium]
MKLKEKVVQSVKWLFIAQLSSQLIRTLVTILVIRDFDAREMSFVALSQTITGFLEIFSTLGLNAAIISKKDITKRDLQNIFGLVLVINAVLLAIVMGGANYFSSFYNTPEVADILRVSGWSFLFVALGFIPNAMLVKDMRFKATSIIQVIAGLSGALISYVCAKNGLGYWALVYGGIAYPVIGTILKIALSPTMVWPRFSLSESLRHISFGTYVMAGGITWYFFVTMDIVIAGRFWTAETLGVYAIAVQIAAMSLNRTIPLLKQVALPAFSRSIVQDRSLLESHVVKALKLSIFASVPMFWGVAATATLAVPIFLGENWRAATLPLAFLCIGAPFRFLIELLSPAVVAAGYPKEVFKNGVVISLVMVIFYLVVVLNSTSPALLAAVWMIVYPMLSLHASHRYCKWLQINSMAIYKGIFPILMSGLAMLAVVLFMVLNLSDAMNRALLLGLAVATGVIIYIGALFLIDRKTLMEVFSMYRGSKKKAPAQAK